MIPGSGPADIPTILNFWSVSMLSFLTKAGAALGLSTVSVTALAATCCAAGAACCAGLLPCCW